MLWKTGTLKHFSKFSGKYLSRSLFFSLHVVVLHFKFIKNVLLQFLQYFAEQVFHWLWMTNSNFFFDAVFLRTFVNLLFNQYDVGLNHNLHTRCNKILIEIVFHNFLDLALKLPQRRQ